MSFIIDTLTDLGMSVSDAKTVIIDGLRGPAKSRLLKPLLHSHKQKGTCLRLQGGRGAVDLPFRKQHPYLGVVLSYDKFEQLSLQARIKQGWANFSRLFSVLRSKCILPKQRLQLWVSCVFSTRYGLTSSGLAPTVFARWWQNKFVLSSSRPAGSPMNPLVSYSRDIILRIRSRNLPGPSRSAVPSHLSL